MKLFTWIKQNKLASILLFIIGFYLFGQLISIIGIGTSSLTLPNPSKSMRYSQESMRGAPPPLADMEPYDVDYPPTTGTDRMVVQESNLSLLVKDVVSTRKQILSYVQTSGGYMVNSNVSNPADAPTATIVVRIPSNMLDDALEYLRSLSIKVVSEYLNGQDVTDQYVDVAARIALLEKTKQRFETILTETREISDITNLNREIINIQAQIDSLKGQQDALSKRAKLAKVTIYLSTDEIALPYAPSETFRPDVIFKLAVRSLVGNLRKVATIVIWLVVYAVFWVPVLLIILYHRKRLKKA